MERKTIEKIEETKEHTLATPHSIPHRRKWNGCKPRHRPPQQSMRSLRQRAPRRPKPHRIRKICTTVCTTFESGNMRGNKNVCEVLPIGKVPEKPEVTGYTGI